MFAYFIMNFSKKTLSHTETPFVYFLSCKQLLPFFNKNVAHPLISSYVHMSTVFQNWLKSWKLQDINVITLPLLCSFFVNAHSLMTLSRVYLATWQQPDFLQTPCFYLFLSLGSKQKRNKLIRLCIFCLLKLFEITNTGLFVLFLRG